MEEKRIKFLMKDETPITTSYHSDIVVSLELGSNDATYHQSLFSMIKWMVELGEVYICLDCSKISSHLDLPHEGKLLQLYHKFAYLKKNHNMEMVYVPSDLSI